MPRYAVCNDFANADHVPQLQRRKETMTLFTTYLKGGSIQGLDGIVNFTREQMQHIERRGEKSYSST